MSRPSEFLQPEPWMQWRRDWLNNPSNQREVSTLLNLVAANKAVFLLGQHQVGKTSLAGAVAESLETGGNYETFFTTPPLFLPNAVPVHGGINSIVYKPLNPTAMSAIDQETASGKKVLLVIDESSSAPPEFVHQLRLRNYLTNPNVAFLLIGQGNIQTPNITQWANLFAGESVGVLELPLNP